MTSATLRLPAITIIITPVQMCRKDMTTKHNCKLLHTSSAANCAVTLWKYNACVPRQPKTFGTRPSCTNRCALHQQLEVQDGAALHKRIPV